jgi:hexosaminidase
MPQPAELHVSGADVKISSTLTLSLNGSTNTLLSDAAMRMLDRLETQTGVQIVKSFQQTTNSTIYIEIVDQSVVRPTLGVDESYSIDSQDGRIHIKAKTIFGAMHSFETLLQLVQARGSQYIVPGVTITDGPRFPWRGLLLDPGRRFLPLDVILRILDGMAAVKMNVLHWHLTEDQGFRIESLTFPKLHQLGSEGKYYTQAQVREVVAYASARGIRVVPEFDMPGHSTSWLVGYPELASHAGPYHVEHENRIFDAVLDPTRESTYRFLDSFFGEMATLFPDEYVHIGGDESNGKDWAANPAIISFMQQHQLENTQALQAYFNLRVQALLKKHGKQMVGWDEILNTNLSPEVVIQNWHGTEFLIDAAREGHRGLLSQPYYLDHMYSAAEMYAADPVPTGSNLSDAEAKRVLGGEACMWGEQISGLTAESRIWPRTAAVAERFWSPSTTRDINDMYRRLAVTSLRLDALGVTHISTPQRGLRQLADSEAGGVELGVLASVLQPADFEIRAEQQHTSPLTPIGSFIDFTRPDPPAQHDFQILVDQYLIDSNSTARQLHKEQLEVIFRSWIAVSPELDELAATRPLLAETNERRKELPRLGLLGLQSLGYIEANAAPPPDWTAAEKELLKNAADHTEMVDFVVLTPLKKLFDTASKP